MNHSGNEHLSSGSPQAALLTKDFAPNIWYTLYFSTGQGCWNTSTQCQAIVYIVFATHDSIYDPVWTNNGKNTTYNPRHMNMSYHSAYSRSQLRPASWWWSAQLRGLSLLHKHTWTRSDYSTDIFLSTGHWKTCHSLLPRWMFSFELLLN